MAETFKRTSGPLTTLNTDYEIYRAPSTAGNVAIVLSCLVANIDGVSSCDVTVFIKDSPNTSTLVTLANTISVPPDASLEVIANKLVLNAGERLVAKASASGDLEVTVSALEIT